MAFSRTTTNSISGILLTTIQFIEHPGLCLQITKNMSVKKWHIWPHETSKVQTTETFFLKIKSGTRKIAQPINHLPFRHEDLGKQRQADLQYLLLPSFIYLSRSRSVWDPVSNTMVRSVWGAKSKGAFWLPHICTFMCNHRQQYEHLCTHKKNTSNKNMKHFCLLYSILWNF